jgi:hypothetical protein
MTDSPPRSALEIAMERLRRKDAEQGIERRPLTDAQKAEIAEVRSQYEAKLAQEDVMHASELAKVWELEARETLEREYRRTRERLMSERDGKIDRIRERAEHGS